LLKKFLIITLFLLTGTGAAQYLGYNDLLELIKIADTPAKFDKFLTERGFDYSAGEDEGGYGDGILSYTYAKEMDDDYYYVGVYHDSTNGYTSVGESSLKEARWEHYLDIVTTHGYTKSEESTDDDEVMWIEFEKDEYSIRIIRHKEDDEVDYNLILTKDTQKNSPHVH